MYLELLLISWLFILGLGSLTIKAITDNKILNELFKTII